MTSESSSDIASALQNQPELAGTLRFFGDWFGRAFDNTHRLVSAEARGDLLALRFNEDETLLIDDPGGFSLRSAGYPSPRMVIESATRVRWEWFSYGRPHVPENRFFIEYRHHGDRVDRTTDWPRESEGVSTENPSFPAVELF